MNETAAKRAMIKRIFSKLYVVIAILALLAFLCAALSEKFQWFEFESPYTIEDFREEVKDLSSEYQQKNTLIYKRFQEEIQTAGMQEFQTADQNAERAVKAICNAKATTQLIMMMIRDKVKNENTAQQQINQILSPLILNHCAKGSAQINDVLSRFLLQLQENNNQFHAECAQKVKKLDRKQDQISAEGFIRKIGDFHEQTAKMMQARLFTAIGTTLEIILIRQTVSAFTKLTAKAAAKLGSSAALSLADGPLPIMDIIAVIGAGWTVVEIYHALKIMPDRLERTLHEAIADCQNEIRNGAISQAEKAFRESQKTISELAIQI